MNTTFFQKASENKRSISWGDIFSDVWKKHRKDQRTALLTKGMGSHIPAPNRMLSDWQKPWLFARVLIAGLVLSVLINYLTFTEPKALKKLNDFSNITLKMYNVDVTIEDFHTKGYIFKKEEIYRIIIGSSNITKTALTTNREWNTRLISTEEGEVTQNIIEEFNELWNSEYALNFDEFYEQYKEKYRIIKKQRKIALGEEIPSIEKYRLEPN